MNKKKKDGVFCRVNGGKNLIDLENKATLQEIMEALLDMYFPEWENTIQGILLNDVEFYIGNYAGKPLKSILKNGKKFPLENYYEEIRTYPIRLYLFTSPKDPDDEMCTSEKTPVSWTYFNALLHHNNEFLFHVYSVCVVLDPYDIVSFLS